MSRKRLFAYAIGIILLIALLSICLLARGRPSATPVPAPEKGKQTIVPSPAISRINEQPTTTTSTAGSGGQCGNVDLSPGGQLLGPANASQVENCFWQAYQQCHSASLTLTITGKDAVSKHTFSTIQQQSSCIVSDVVQSSTMGQPSSQDTYNCAKLESSGTALHFVNCGDEGTIDVPSS